MIATTQPGDGLRRTAFFEPSVTPTVPGDYECATGGGHIFRRVFDGTTWLNSVDGKPTSVRMTWRGVAPGSVSVMQYPQNVRMLLLPPATKAALEGAFRTVLDMTDPNIGALAA